MVKWKPAAVPPNTAPGGAVPPPVAPQGSGRHVSAENPESLNSIALESRRSEGPIIVARTHPVIFTVFNDNNAIRFLSQLLIALQAVDSTAKILPHSDAPSVYVPLGRTKEIPIGNDAAVEKFVTAYLAGLKMSPEGDMKGKVMIQAQAKFENLKRNHKFQQWFKGSEVEPVRPVVKLDLTELSGNRRIASGFFFNVVARHDMAGNFQQQMKNALFSTISTSGPIPEFEIAVSSLHDNDAGRLRLYRAFTSTTANVQILNEKMTAIMSSPSTDISYIPQIVWDSLLRPKKTEYFKMQQNFAASHNALRFVGVKNANLLLAPTTNISTGAVSRSTPAISIYTWLTRVTSSDGYILFPKVFPCYDGDIELWYHMSHDKETRAWLSTALAEIAKLSSINLESNRMDAEAMFKNPEKVWNSLAKLNRGVSLPAQRSIFMEFCPPTGVVTFPTRDSVQSKNSRNNRKGGPKQFKLVFDMEAATTVSALTADDTKSRASSKSRRPNTRRRKAANAPETIGSGTTTTTADPEKIAAGNAAKKATEIANAAVQKYPPKVQTAHRGAYDTIADAYGNLLPVVRINNTWVPLTAESLLESRKKAPPLNFGLTGRQVQPPAINRVHDTTNVVTQSSSASPRSALVAPNVIPQHSEWTTTSQGINEAKQSGRGKHQATASDARIGKQVPMDTTTYGLEDNEDLETVGDDTMVVDIDDVSTVFGSAASLGTTSETSVATKGESSVTWANVAAHQTYDPAATPENVVHNQDSSSVDMQFHNKSSMDMLSKKSKKTYKKISSLEAAAAAAAASMSLGHNQDQTQAVYPSQEKAERQRRAHEEAATRAAKIKGTAIPVVESAEAIPSNASPEIMQQLAELREANANLMALVRRLQHDQAVIALNPGNSTSSLTRLWQTTQAQQSLSIPKEQIDALAFHDEGAMQMTVYTPPRQRRSKKTPHAYEFTEIQRTPPREPEGQPQSKKKSRMCVSPRTNRYALLDDQDTAEDMNDVESDNSSSDMEQSIAEVQSKLAATTIRNTPVGPDSFTNKGAGLHK